jgi:hypothetical protein
MPKLTNTTALPLATSHTDDALIYIVDDSGATPTSKTIQAQHLINRYYGTVSVNDNSNAQTVVADTWTKLDRFDVGTAGLQNDITIVVADGGSHYLRPTATGIYRCHYSASIASASGAGTITTGLYLNTTLDVSSQSAHKLDSNYTGNFSASTIIDVTSLTGTAADISLWVKSTHTSLILSNGQIVIERLSTT